MADVCLFTVNKDRVRVSWELTQECNLRCFYCCHDSTIEKSAKTLDESTCYRIINELKHSSVTQIYLTGGEPTLHPSFIQIVLRLCEFADCTIASNGTLLNREMLSKIKDVKSKISFHISLDGHNSNIHDKVRGVDGCFKKTMKTIKLLINHGYRVRVGTLLSRSNANNIDDIIQLCTRYKVPTIVLSWPIQIGQFDINDYPLFTLKEFHEVQLPHIRRISEDIDIIIKRPYFSGEIPSDCLGGDNLFHIDASGVVSPCSWVAKLLPEYRSEYCLDETGFGDLMFASAIQKFIQFRKFRTSKFGNGCPIACLVNNGSIETTDPINGSLVLGDKTDVYI